MTKEMQRFIEFGLTSARMELQIAKVLREMVIDTIENNAILLELDRQVVKLREEIEYLLSFEDDEPEHRAGFIQGGTNGTQTQKVEVHERKQG